MELQAAKVSLRFEADLSNAILDNVQGEPGAMPLLQHALLELWKRRHGRWLRAEEYRALGGVKKAIAETAEAVYRDLPEADRERVRDIFVRLAAWTRCSNSAATSLLSQSMTSRLPLILPVTTAMPSMIHGRPNQCHNSAGVGWRCW